MATSEYGFCFVAQRGKLEVQGLLLALSLAKNVRCSYEMIAAVPIGYGEISPETSEVLATLGTQIVGITNHIHCDYPIGNKLSCLRTANEITKARYLIFLDTDMFCNLTFDGVPEIDSYDLSLRAAGFARWKDEAQWEPLYQMFGLPLPSERIHSLRTHEKMLPYFNGGFIGSHAQSAFPEMWLETAQIIYQRFQGDRSRLHWLDQIAIPIAMQRLGMSYQCVDPKYNSTPATRDGAIFQHYHYFRRLTEEIPQCASLLADIFQRYPFLKEKVGHLMESCKESSLLK